MSSSFTDFLRDKAAKEAAVTQANKAVIDEWRDAVERLFAQIRAWLKESDPDKIVAIEESQADVREPDLGRYQVPRLNLRAFGKWIALIPKARKTVGMATPPQKSAPERAAGRVDITDERRRYVLYRFQEDGRDVWLIDDLHSEPKPLNQEIFERALISYLR
jgi:hypothetical protein